MKKLRVKVELLVNYIDEQGMTKKNAIDLLKDQLSEIGEEWDNCDVPEGMEMPWGEMNVDKIIDLDYYEFNITYDDSPFCEHCGENHSPFGASISDGGTQWCIDCHSDLTEEEKKEIRIKEKKGEIAYHKKRLKELEK